MLSDTLLDIYKRIADNAGEMVAAYVDKIDLTGQVNYASIFSQTEDEFIRYTNELQANGVVYDVQSTGNYYMLNEPFITAAGPVSVCRVRRHDLEHTERGYLDFEVVNYKKFKAKYLQTPYFALLDMPYVELVELRAPGHDVRAYFPDGF